MLALTGKLGIQEVPEVLKRLQAEAPKEGPLRLDLSGLSQIDSAGVAMLAIEAKRLQKQGQRLELVKVPPKLQETLKLFPMVASPGDQPAAPKDKLLVRLGGFGAEAFEILIQYLQLFADAAWFMVSGFFKKKGIDWSQVLFEMAQMGSKALGVVGLIAFLVGGTMALQAATQLRQFGANIFVVDLIGISMTRELGPLMAAIVVAGRSGSSVAAEIGTMVITEEIDALKTMGFHPTRFLVVPKLLAITLTQPLLTAFADFLGILGAFVVAVTSLEIGPDTFMDRLHQSLFLKDVLTGVLKSVIFAQIIVTIGAISGFRTQGGADAVGRSTTRAVVASIFTVIVADAIASIVFYVGG